MVLGIVWLFLVEIPVLCGWSCWSKTGSGLWSVVSEVCARSGKYRKGCNYAFWCHGMSGDGGVYGLNAM